MAILTPSHHQQHHGHVPLGRDGRAPLFLTYHRSAEIHTGVSGGYRKKPLWPLLVGITEPNPLRSALTSGSLLLPFPKRSRSSRSSKAAGRGGGRRDCVWHTQTRPLLSRLGSTLPARPSLRLHRQPRGFNGSSQAASRARTGLPENDVYERPGRGGGVGGQGRRRVSATGRWILRGAWRFGDADPDVCFRVTPRPGQGPGQGRLTFDPGLPSQQRPIKAKAIPAAATSRMPSPQYGNAGERTRASH